MEVITHFTYSEGGVWQKCTTELPSEEDLQLLIANAVPDAGHSGLKVTTQLIPGKQVHSFRTNKNRTWDVLNGWRGSRSNSYS